MAPNSIIAPLHTIMQVQPSVCSMIPFCITCGSHSSVHESSPLVYYTKLIGKMLLIFQTSMLPTSTGKNVSVQVMKEYAEPEV